MFMSTAQQHHFIDPKCHQLEMEIKRLQRRIDEIQRCYGDEEHHLIGYFEEMIASRKDYLQILQQH